MAYAGCPVGALMTHLSSSTPLPHCVKMSHSSLGGCYVNCPGVCVDNGETKGPIHSMGMECTPGGGDGGSDNDGGGGSDNGSDNGGDAGGDDNGTDTGGSDGNNSGNGPIGGPTDGMSVGRVTPMLVGDKSVADIAPGFNAILADLWLIKHAATRTEDSARGIFENSIKMQQDISRIVHSSGTLSNIFSQSTGESNYYLKSILDKVNSNTGNTGGTTGGGDTETGDDFDQQSLFRVLEAINDNISRTGGATATNSGDLLQAFYSLQQQLASGDAGGSQQGGGEGAGGADIDYSKMPGSESTPLSVRSASYDSKGCEGGANCFFDLATMQGKLDEANNALTGSYKAISDDMKRIFSFNFYGSAEPMKCLDLFSLYGKDYSVCPPSSDFWSTLAALMMFIFYFVALMVIFKR